MSVSLAEKYQGMKLPEKGPYYLNMWNGPPKVSLVGTCSVGKTSIINALRNTLVEEKPVVVVPEVATDFFGNPITLEDLDALFKSGYRRDFDELPITIIRWIRGSSRTRWRTQNNILTNIINREQKMAEYFSPSDAVFLCDRGGLCSMVYTFAHGDLASAQYMFESTYWWINTYAEIALLDPEGVPYVPNDVRSETPEERLRIHHAYIEFCGLYNIPFRLISGPLDERIAHVKSLLASASQMVGK